MPVAFIYDSNLENLYNSRGLSIFFTNFEELLKNNFPGITEHEIMKNLNEQLKFETFIPIHGQDNSGVSSLIFSL